MKNKLLIFGTSTPRSGGSLVSNMLSSHRDIIITKDLIHFFRHIFNKYKPIEKDKNKYLLVEELCLRILIRNRIKLSPKIIIKKIQYSKNYDEIIREISNYLLSKLKKKKIVGETANTEWRNIEIFLKLNKNNKSFQVIRDPRAILSSWKKLTYAKGYKYLNILFAWIDAINFSEKNLKNFKSRFIRIKFEDVHKNPKKIAKNLCKFFGVHFDMNMVRQKKWPKLLKNKLNFINVSSYTNKETFGFSNERTLRWRESIEEWELALVQHLFKKQLKKLKYKIYNVDKSLIAKALKILKSDKLLWKNYKYFIRTGKGSDKRLNDPSKPENWGAVDYSKDIKAKFIDSNEYKIFKRRMLIIKKNSKNFDYKSYR